MAGFTIRDSDFKGPFFWTVYRNNFLSNFQKYYEENDKLKTYEWFNSAKQKADELGGKWEVKKMNAANAASYSGGTEWSVDLVPAMTWDEYRAYPLSWKAKSIIKLLHDNGFNWNTYHADLRHAFNNWSYAGVQYPIDKSNVENYIASLEDLWQGIYEDEPENVNAGFPDPVDPPGGNDPSLSNIFAIKNLVIVGAIFLVLIFLIYLYA
ncbi:MAG: hypothetical protein PF448_08775 [Bacteroidales bacterium]|jgi:hypothetical protein|nr:hypothetical protein [Bacteroidales bacterium]